MTYTLEYSVKDKPAYWRNFKKNYANNIPAIDNALLALYKAKWTSNLGISGYLEFPNLETAVQFILEWS